jgi:hypothetical protein
MEFRSYKVDDTGLVLPVNGILSFSLDFDFSMLTPDPLLCEVLLDDLLSNAMDLV